MVVKGEAVRCNAEDQFRFGEVVDAQVWHGDAFADVAVTLVLLVRLL